jgi:hypothetical protein
MCKSYVPDVINRKHLTKNKFYSHYLPMNQLLNCVMKFHVNKFEETLKDTENFCQYIKLDKICL